MLRIHCFIKPVSAAASSLNYRSSQAENTCWLQTTRREEPLFQAKCISEQHAVTRNKGEKQVLHLRLLGVCEKRVNNVLPPLFFFKKNK